MNTRGVLLFAHDNGLMDYVGMAVACASKIKKHLGDVDICIVMDTATETRMREEYTPEAISFLFDKISNVSTSTEPRQQQRGYKGGGGEGELAPYHNTTRAFSYLLSPYDETVVMDIDYMVQNDLLNGVWGSGEEFMMNASVTSIYGANNPSEIHRLDDSAINMYWATVFYFKKCRRVEMAFELILRLIQHYEYYSVIFGYPSNLIRMDFVFAIMNHIMSGYANDAENYFQPLPVPNVQTAWDEDVLVGVRGDSLLFVTKCPHGDQAIPCAVGNNVHVMNKFSLSRVVPEIVDSAFPEGIKCRK